MTVSTLKLGLGACALAFASSVTTAAMAAAPRSPTANMSGGLRQMVERYEAAPLSAASAAAANTSATVDQRGRVLVDVHADGKLPLQALRKRVASLDAAVLDVYPEYRNGIVSAYVPMARMTSLATSQGVSAVALVHKPVTDVGKATSQGTQVIRSDLVNAAGVTGAGITVGILSDSFNRSLSAKFHASKDVDTGDLPNIRVVNGSPGVKFAIEPPRLRPGEPPLYDEGRAMAQIIHDVAPGAALCFATALKTQAQFARNIRTLRTNPACNADVIVDDALYLAEPMFSDGLIAQAVDQVVNSTKLPGKRVAYFASAGNRGAGYTDRFRAVSPADAALLDAADTSIDLSSIPASLDISGGFQDFDEGPGVDISQQVTCGGRTTPCRIVFQWNDPFDRPGAMTADYNLLVFDSAGQYVSTLSLTDDNFATSQPLEVSTTELAAGSTYHVVIARTGGGSGEARFLKYVFFGGDMIAQYNRAPGKNASSYGHNSAAGANGVAAYVYDDVLIDAPPFEGYQPAIESFSSGGPALIFFDAAGNRLAEPERRQRPNIAAPDGGNTTFFPTGAVEDHDYDGDDLPNFFGTSAAAPHAAGVAALMLERAGGPGRLKPEVLREALEKTTPARDADPLTSRIRDGDGVLQLTANGGLPYDTGFFQIDLAGEGLRLEQLSIDLGPTGLQFNPNGFPLTVGSSTGPVISSPLPTTPSTLLELSFSGFDSGDSLRFGINRDLAATGNYGNSADQIAGAIVRYRYAKADGSGATVVSKVMANKIGSGYSLRDGYGLIDAVKAVRAVAPR